MVPLGDLGAVGALRRAWARALTISAPWNQLPCMFGVSAFVLSDFLRLATGGRKKKQNMRSIPGSHKLIMGVWTLTLGARTLIQSVALLLFSKLVGG